MGCFVECVVQFRFFFLEMVFRFFSKKIVFGVIFKY